MADETSRGTDRYRLEQVPGRPGQWRIAETADELADRARLLKVGLYLLAVHGWGFLVPTAIVCLWAGRRAVIAAVDRWAGDVEDGAGQ